MIFGVDPGSTGAIAWFNRSGGLVVHDMPVTAKTYGKGRQLDIYALSRLIDSSGFIAGTSKVYIERPNAMAPKGQRMGSVSAFTYGEGIGILQAVFTLKGISLFWVLPTRWKQTCGLAGKNKEASLRRVRETYPLMDEFERQKDHNRAEAVLILEYGSGLYGAP